jgi:hypothetical protein
MKTKIFLFIILSLMTFCFIGCSSLFSLLFIKPAMYSFAENDSENGSAVIDFVGGSKSGVRLVDCEGIPVPPPAKGTNWESAVIFPAGKELNIRVYVFWDEDRYGERRRGIFRCPPLEAGREYKLRFKGGYKNGGTLLLTDAYSDRIIIYEQVIPTLE